MSPRPPGLTVAFAAALVMCGMSLGLAQRPTPPPPPPPAAPATPGPTPKPQAYVRFWNMLIGPNAPSLQLLQSENQPMTTALPGNYFAGYLAVDPAVYTFIVCRSNDPTAVLKRMPITLRADVYITLLAAAGKDGRPDVQLIDDTVNPKADDGLSTVVVRHFFPGANVTVSTGSQAAAVPLAFGETTTFSGLPLQPTTMLTMQATGLGPGTKTWKVEVDFTVGRHATMLVIPDPYGRFRPQLVLDGSVLKPMLPPPNKPHAPGA